MESLVVHKIVDTFKIYSAPDQLEETDYTRVYNLPAVFKIQFYNGSTEHMEIGHIGHCALTNISVTYGGSKFSTFAGTHYPTQVDVSLAIQERELLNRQMLEADVIGGEQMMTGAGGGQSVSTSGGGAGWE